MKLIIENFQSIEKCELEIPEKKFTCIVGRSNIGKSAIRRALECVLFNNSQVSYIRNGCDSCKVNLIFENGDEVIWTRNDKTAKYIINGQEYTKLSKAVPEEIINKGFREITLNNKEKLNIQIARQFDNIFLLKETGSTTTEVLSNLGNLNKIIRANKVCKSDKDEVRKKISVRKDDLINVKEKISVFGKLPEYQIKYVKLISQIEDINISKENVEKIKKLYLIYINLLSKIDVLKKDIKIPVLSIDINRYENILILYNKFYLSLSKLDIYKDFGKEIKISIDIDRYIKIKELYDKYLKLLKNIKILEKDIEIKTFLLDIDRYESVKILYIKLRKMIARVDVLKSLPEVISLDLGVEKYENIKSLYEKLVSLYKKILGIKESLQNTEIILGDSLKEKSLIEKELKVCPLCERDFWL